MLNLFFLTLFTLINLHLNPNHDFLVRTTYFQTAQNTLELPSSLAEDDSFEDLPFEQLRQALREEVETNPKKGPSKRSFKKYNFLIR